MRITSKDLYWSRYCNPKFSVLDNFVTTIAGIPEKVIDKMNSQLVSDNGYFEYNGTILWTELKDSSLSGGIKFNGNEYFTEVEFNDFPNHCMTKGKLNGAAFSYVLALAAEKIN